MFLDGRQLPDGTMLRADVAVVGAGPAGIVVALELANRGRRVLLVESGGVGHRADESLSTLSYADPRHKPMTLATSRRLGGASNLWGGRCVPFDPVDFEERTYVSDARWPIAYADVASYYQRACDWCLCGDAIFDAREIPGLAKRMLVPGLRNEDVLSTHLERWSLPTNFGSTYREQIRASSAVTLVTDMTCTEIVSDEDGNATSHLCLRGPNGTSVSLKARAYVIACGGLETTRLLFASRHRRAEGLGNHSGHLGRWYMAHVDSSIATVRFSTPPEATIYGHERDPAGVYVRRRFTFSEEAQREESLSNAAIWIVNPAIADPSHGSAILSFVYLMLASPLGHYFIAEAIRQAHVEASEPPALGRHLANLMRDLPAATVFAIRFAYERYLRRGRKVPGFFVPSASNDYALHYHGEHLPHWDSYVEPTTERDSLGVPRLKTHISFSDDDVESAVRAHERLGRYLVRQGVGEVSFASPDPRALVREQVYGGYHQAGTTRMSACSENGVVDRDLAVHGFRDLFVASSSVFATSGQANSTFTLVALAVRLADHLASLVSSPVA